MGLKPKLAVHDHVFNNFVVMLVNADDVSFRLTTRISTGFTAVMLAIELGPAFPVTSATEWILAWRCTIAVPYTAV